MILKYLQLDPLKIRKFMFHPLFHIPTLHLTAWKMVGFLGVLIFGSRWFIQLFASKKAGRPIVTRLFWVLSLIGSILLLLYFTFGKNDSVGILSNLFPAVIATYNIYLEHSYLKNNKVFKAIGKNCC
jgi:lipid-A-disaccharide synthase-like uncharacterized protein